jgi:hypothetical protein
MALVDKEVLTSLAGLHSGRPALARFCLGFFSFVTDDRQDFEALAWGGLLRCRRVE